LRLTKVAPVEVTLCAPFEVAITVANEGRTPLTQVQVSDELPPGLKAVAADTPPNWDVGTLAPGATREFRFQVRAEAPGEYVNRVRATSAEGGRAEAIATTTVRAPVLGIECEALDKVLIGRTMDVCLTARNTGDTNEAKVVVRLQVPEGARVAGVSEGGVASPVDVIWEVADLGPAAARAFCATFKAVGTGEFLFQTSVTGACAQPVESACATHVIGIPAILLEVVDLEDPVPVGEPVTYQIRVTNQGSAPSTNVRLTCALPEGQEFVSGTGDTAVSAEGRTVKLATLPTLAPKAEAVWQVVVKATAAGDARFDVKLASDQFTNPIEEIEATTQY
jgi:uncharacterized repeat protein (TIGR01451 family)